MVTCRGSLLSGRDFLACAGTSPGQGSLSRTILNSSRMDDDDLERSRCDKRRKDAIGDTGSLLAQLAHIIEIRKTFAYCRSGLHPRMRQAFWETTAQLTDSEFRHSFRMSRSFFSTVIEQLREPFREDLMMSDLRNVSVEP